MITLYYTYRIYRKLVNPVLGRRKLNQAGFFSSYPSIKNREYPHCYTMKLQAICNAMIHRGCMGSERCLPAKPFCSAVRSRYSLQKISKIKGRVERDCLNVSQNKTDGGCNVHCANASLEAPTS